jgi:hypothetical protein
MKVQNLAEFRLVPPVAATSVGWPTLCIGECQRIRGEKEMQQEATLG